MAQTVQVVLAAVLVSIGVAAFVPFEVRQASSCAAAAAQCRFTFEGVSGLYTLTPGVTGKALTPKIILKKCDPSLYAAVRAEISVSPSESEAPYLPTPAVSPANFETPTPTPAVSPANFETPTLTPTPVTSPSNIETPTPVSSPSNIETPKPSPAVSSVYPPECTLGDVDETLEAYFLGANSTSFVLISQFEGPSQAFSPAFFKAFPVLGIDGYWGSGVGHEAPQGDQADYLSGSCAVLPLGEWQEYGPDGLLLNIGGGDPFTDCVAFAVA
eukprot:CAMPEP_0184681912 /NCGR_PEP_ID=MMETSP0312-20130426/4896_1 /TAXON_ID=31354 /ORGANISM="Compsopogon coeruleus, Strain SAG 36.94" /LENGTH=270 /DNA_ID=CAMNT_0027133047 /DNA_START=70 /DNA_END=882 /DNA_ORIENTATION=+